MGNKVEMIVMMETLKAMGVPLVSMKVCESSEFHLLQVSPRSQKDAGPEWIQLVIQSQLRQLPEKSPLVTENTAPPQCSRTSQFTVQLMKWPFCRIWYIMNNSFSYFKIEQHDLYLLRKS